MITAPRIARRALAAAAVLGMTAGGLALAGPATASAVPRVETVSGATYVSFDDLPSWQFDSVEDVADEVNRILPGEEEVVFAVNKRGPRSAIGVFAPRRSGISLAVECDPEVDTWDSYLGGSCSGNEESLPVR
ncbi:hypothetical protein [Dietzia sp. UBA5065]|uniref:hypothetical protein n=1 Tax=Dietzia sp. UBA5065 TaxID=1946422 RepID=UPI0025C6AFDB|nr:hypothetical protein [Dietzia sp. UBA5065]